MKSEAGEGKRNQAVNLPREGQGCGSGREEGQELYPLPLRLFQGQAAVPCTIRLKPTAAGIAGGVAFSDGAGGTPDLAQSEEEQAWGYYNLAEAGNLLDHLLARLQGTEYSSLPLMERTRFVYDTLLVWLQYFFHGAPETLIPERLQPAQDLLRAWFGLIREAPQPRNLVQTVRRHDSGLFTHSVNVAVLGLAFVRHLGWPEPEAAVFGLGALLHDIGMISLPRSLWGKTGLLTSEEQEAIKAHPQAGVHFLENLSHLPETVVFMVAQHHESDDGSGYPLGLPEPAIHPWARLLRLLDAYEAMTSIRPWRAPLSSPKALKILRHAAGGPSTLALLAGLEEFFRENADPS